MTPIDIRPADLATVRRILREHVPALEVRAFGSRVAWNARETSDLDLALMTDEPLSIDRTAKLRAAFTDSDLPCRVDIVDWAAASESFRQQIRFHSTPVVGAIDVSRIEHRVETPPPWVRHDVCDLIRDGVLVVGDGYRAKNSELSGSGLPFARAGNIAGGFRFSGADRFPEGGLHKVGDKTSRPGDVVFTSKGTVGRFAFVRADTDHFVYSPQLCFWRSMDRKALDPYFLYCWMRGPEFFEQFKGVAGQTDMAEYVSLTDQRRMFVTLPPLNEQRVIAHILGTLDEKIELNRRMNATLEAMARALFRSWFVDFDPVRAKMEGRDTGLPKEIADLFPDRLAGSDGGEVPEGWAVESLAGHFEVMKGVSYKGSGLRGDGMPLHNLNSIHEGGGYKYEGIKFYSGEYAERHCVRPGDVIVANTEQGHDRLLIGYAAIVPGLFGASGIASHHVYRLRPRSASWLSTRFLLFLLNSTRMHDLVSGYANGTTVNMLPTDGVQRPSFVVPPRALVDAFGLVASCSEQRREQAVRDSRTLTVVREALLPKLVSGELRIRDAERFVGAIA